MSTSGSLLQPLQRPLPHLQEPNLQLPIRPHLHLPASYDLGRQLIIEILLPTTPGTMLPCGTVHTDLATPLSTPSTTSCRGVFIQPLGFSYCHFTRLIASTRLVTQPRSTSTGLFHCCQQLAHRQATTWSPSYPSFSSKLQELRSTDVSKVPELRDIAIERV